MMIEMELVEIQISEELGPYIVILREKEGERHFPIFIGSYEVAILDQTVRGLKTPRPLTHDLVLNAIHALGGTLSGVVVDELVGNTFIGKLLVKTPDGETVRVDTRPSDAMVLAMKHKAPIYVESDVLDATTQEGGLEEADDDDSLLDEDGDDADQDDE